MIILVKNQHIAYESCVFNLSPLKYTQANKSAVSFHMVFTDSQDWIWSATCKAGAGISCQICFQLSRYITEMNLVVV